MEYTTGSDNIYFLNDKNIASGTETSCKAGFNAVPSQQAFVEKYKELTAYDSGLCAVISDEIRPGLETLSGLAEQISSAAKADYVKKTGDTIGYLSVTGDLSVGGDITSKYFYTSDSGETVFTTPIGHGGVQFKFEHGAGDISVDGSGTTLQTYVSEASSNALSESKSYTEEVSGQLSNHIEDRITANKQSLSVAAITASSGYMFDQLKQENGKISVGQRLITSADIPLLPESKIENLTTKYATNEGVISCKYVKTNHLFLQYNKGGKQIHLVDTEHMVSSTISCDDFIKDGMLSNVEVLTDGTGHSEENGPYLVMEWNADAGIPSKWIEIKKLTYPYKSDDSGLSISDYKIRLNYDVVARKAELQPVQDYVNQLSTGNGIIEQLSNDISALNIQNVRQVKFDGHIQYATKGDALSAILMQCGDIAVENTARNNSMFDVRFKVAGLSGDSGKFETSDGFTLGNGDIVLIHDCDASKTEIQLDNLTSANVRILHSGVSRYEFADEKTTREEADDFLSGKIDGLLSDTVKLSGNNHISGGNHISGDNCFENGTLSISCAYITENLSVDFSKLVDTNTMSSIAEISTDLTAQLCTASCDLSSQLCSTSCELCTEIKSHINRIDNPHSVTASQLSVYLCSETSSKSDLETKFNTLSTYSQIHDELSNDGYLIAHQSLDNYYTKTETDSHISGDFTAMISTALLSAPSFDSVLSLEASAFTLTDVVSVLKDIKNIFACLSSGKKS